MQMQDLVQDTMVWSKTKNVFKKITRSLSLGSNVNEADQEASTRSESLASTNSSVTYRDDIQVTFHQRELFMETFKDFFSD